MSKLKNLEMSLAQTGNVALNINQGSAATVFQHFIRDYLGRTDLAVSTENYAVDFDAKLENVRTLLAGQRVDDAQVLLGNIKPDGEYQKIEHSLELGRCHFFRGEFRLCIETLIPVISNQEASPVTIMTSHQLIGWCFFQMGDLLEGEKFLLKSHHLSIAFPFANSGYVAKAYLVQLYSEARKLESAQRFLDIIDQILLNEENNDVWLSRKLVALRALSHFQRARSSNIEITETLNSAFVIARFLNDCDIEKRCIDDLKALNLLLDETLVVKRFQAWSYMPNLKLILIDFPPEISRLDSSPQVYEILNLLLNGPMNQSDFFSQIWKIPFSERHANHLRASLSKVRKHLPQGALTVIDSKVTLK